MDATARPPVCPAALAFGAPGLREAGLPDGVRALRSALTAKAAIRG